MTNDADHKIPARFSKPISHTDTLVLRSFIVPIVRLCIIEDMAAYVVVNYTSPVTILLSLRIAYPVQD